MSVFIAPDNFELLNQETRVRTWIQLVDISEYQEKSLRERLNFVGISMGSRHDQQHEDKK